MDTLIFPGQEDFLCHDATHPKIAVNTPSRSATRHSRARYGPPHPLPIAHARPTTRQLC